MAEVWYAIVAGMLSTYVIMDGFDFGAGLVHFLVARNEDERRQVIAAIGPLWDGNEVWLLASGGALFVAFPGVLAAGLSGFYLAIFFVLWALLGRGLAIELRGHVPHPMWRAFWDVVFAATSGLLALLLGAALGNVLRGVPLDEHGWFELTLFTDFSARGDVGILDWYTILVGVFAVLTLAAHGAAFVAWKTGGAVEARATRLSTWLFIAVAALWPIVTYATSRLHAFSLSMVTVTGFVIALGGIGVAIGKRQRARFLGSVIFLAGILAATAAARFPILLESVDGTRTLDVYNSASPTQGLKIALTWWLLGIPLVIGYFALNFRLHRGKVDSL